ncbi:MAG: hypothetical protein A2541_02510 [Candidatus Taylorbacteria bacterium RIFOXYD2_FULL_36_9]|uniref:Hydrolase TatD n=1 Tax=Candidatus Taylorbacteria bacterium RIFOXYD2_FULL_36_9 TaxID=1802338 RepID=A0A1G2PDA8_9BACT|nr:MAG: hypothetical protein A2541_02510 [Candidatus Taylorbacteria bacterium RIFOXYD2_FULL_36_9]
MKYIDIHSHLGFEDYGSDQKEVIERMKENGVGTIAVGADLETSKEAVKVALQNENIWACIGQHPTHNISSENFRYSESFNEKEFEKLVSNSKVVAVGECGLDYFFKGESLVLEGLSLEKVKQKQKELFQKQIEFALKYNKPLMLHIRDGEVKGEAFNDAYELLSKYVDFGQGLSLSELRGNVHFFTGKLEMAQKFIALGFTISFTGLITYVRDFDKIIKNVPLQSLHAETDAPFVAPVPHRGERNEPSYVIEIYKKIAEIRGEDPELVRLQLLKNAKEVCDI